MKTVVLSAFFSFLLFTSSVFSASISGNVVYEGKVPNFKPIKMDADPVCLTFHQEEPAKPQVLMLGEGNTMANIFVRVKSGLPRKDWAAPAEPAVLNQKGCEYTPHVLGVMVNQPVKILNPDGTLHNVHALPENNPEFNLAMPKFRKEVTKTFTKPEFMFPIKCDVHPWMGAWVAVMEHPFFDVTGKDGKYTIDNLPAGEYVIEVWHEKLGTQTEKIKLGEDGTVELNFTFSRP